MCPRIATVYWGHDDTGGVASASLEQWSGVLAAEAGPLLDGSTLASEKAAIAAYFR